MQNLLHFGLTVMKAHETKFYFKCMTCLFNVKDQITPHILTNFAIECNEINKTIFI